MDCGRGVAAPRGVATTRCRDLPLWDCCVDFLYGVVASRDVSALVGGVADRGTSRLPGTPMPRREGNPHFADS